MSDNVSLLIDVSLLTASLLSVPIGIVLVEVSLVIIAVRHATDMSSTQVLLTTNVNCYSFCHIANKCDSLSC